MEVLQNVTLGQRDQKGKQDAYIVFNLADDLETEIIEVAVVLEFSNNLVLAYCFRLLLLTVALHCFPVFCVLQDSHKIKEPGRVFPRDLSSTGLVSIVFNKLKFFFIIFGTRCKSTGDLIQFRLIYFLNMFNLKLNLQAYLIR